MSTENQHEELDGMVTTTDGHHQAELDVIIENGETPDGVGAMLAEKYGVEYVRHQPSGNCWPTLVFRGDRERLCKLYLEL